MGHFNIALKISTVINKKNRQLQTGSEADFYIISPIAATSSEPGRGHSRLSATYLHNLCSVMFHIPNYFQTNRSSRRVGHKLLRGFPLGRWAKIVQPARYPASPRSLLLRTDAVRLSREPPDREIKEEKKGLSYVACVGLLLFLNQMSNIVSPLSLELVVVLYDLVYYFSFCIFTPAIKKYLAIKQLPNKNKKRKY